MKNKLRLGFTFRKPMTDHLALNYKKTFSRLLDLKPDLIRIGARWSEIEPNQRNYNLRLIKSEVKKVKKAGSSIILCVGIKSPGWPEFYIPKWLEGSHIPSLKKNADKYEPIRVAALKFDEKILTEISSLVDIIQIENEPFDRLGVTSNKCLSFNFVKEEVDLARRVAKNKKIMITNSVSFGFSKLVLETYNIVKSSLLADIVGLNI